MIELGIFTSIEFYTIAITVAILLVGFIFKPAEHAPAQTYIYAANIEQANPLDNQDEKYVEIESCDNGTVIIRRKNVELPAESIAHITVDIVDDKLTIVEKHTKNTANSITGLYDLTMKVGCLKSRKYHLRYEIPDSGLWGLTTLTNRNNNKTTLELQY